MFPVSRVICACSGLLTKNDTPAAESMKIKGMENKKTLLIGKPDDLISRNGLDFKQWAEPR
jgi:hypothetical protein